MIVVAVVLNWRDPDSTTLCIESLLREESISLIHVVDNESRGQLADIVGERVRLHEQQENLGFSRGVNIGLREALADDEVDAVLVINNDAVVTEGAIDELIAVLADDDRRIGLVAPVILNPDGSVQSTGGRFRALDAATSDRVDGAAINYLTWACVLIPRSTLLQVGLLDEAFFMYWEDVDYGLRTLASGRTLRIAPRATVVHALSKSHAKAGPAIDRYSARGLVVLARKQSRASVWIGAAFRIALRLVKRALARDGARVQAVVRGVREGWAQPLVGEPTGGQ